MRAKRAYGKSTARILPTNASELHARQSGERRARFPRLNPAESSSQTFVNVEKGKKNVKIRSVIVDRVQRAFRVDEARFLINHTAPINSSSIENLCLAESYICRINARSSA